MRRLRRNECEYVVEEPPLGNTVSADNAALFTERWKSSCMRRRMRTEAHSRYPSAIQVLLRF